MQALTVAWPLNSGKKRLKKQHWTIATDSHELQKRKMKLREHPINKLGVITRHSTGLYSLLKTSVTYTKWSHTIFL